VVYTSFGQPDLWVSLAQQWKVPYYSGDNDWFFDLQTGVDWARYLRVVSTCVSHGSCPGGGGSHSGSSLSPSSGGPVRLAVRGHGRRHTRGRGRHTRH